MQDISFQGIRGFAYGIKQTPVVYKKKTTNMFYTRLAVALDNAGEKDLKNLEKALGQKLENDTLIVDTFVGRGREGIEINGKTIKPKKTNKELLNTVKEFLTGFSKGEKTPNLTQGGYANVTEPIEKLQNGQGAIDYEPETVFRAAKNLAENISNFLRKIH